MNPWVETAAVVLIAICGGLCGRWFSRLGGSKWLLGYLAPLLLVLALLASTYASGRCLVPALAWLSGSRARFIVVCVAVTMGSMTLHGRAKRFIEKAVVLTLMVVVVIWSSVLPFLMPAIIERDLARMPTLLDEDNVCVQTTSYTCAPAAAVTALRQLGISGHEGELAILSHTSPMAGTLPWCLYKALADRYGQEGLSCEIRYFDSVDQLPANSVTLAVVRDAFMLDHCVAILNVTDKTVTIGDPALGRRAMSHKQFEQVWRFYGIVLQRPDNPHS